MTSKITTEMHKIPPDRAERKMKFSKTSFTSRADFFGSAKMVGNESCLLSHPVLGTPRFWLGSKAVPKIYEIQWLDGYTYIFNHSFIGNTYLHFYLIFLMMLCQALKHMLPPYFFVGALLAWLGAVLLHPRYPTISVAVHIGCPFRAKVVFIFAVFTVINGSWKEIGGHVYGAHKSWCKHSFLLRKQPLTQFLSASK